MTSKPLVSVVIPTYHRSAVLVRAIESVLKQTYPNIEILVVDDNGEGSDEQIRSYNAVFPKYNERVIYLTHKENKGGSAARNTGWMHAKGDYITFLDDDDEIASNKIEKQVEILESLDSSWGACYTGYHKEKINGKIVRSKETISGNVYIRALMRTLYVGSGSNLLLRKSVVDDVQGYDIDFKRNQDIEFMARVAKSYKFAFIPEDLLTIHYDVRTYKANNVDDISKFYLEKFSDEINALPPNIKRKVLTVVSLERARFLSSNHMYAGAFRVLKANSVEILPLVKYICYLMNRYITNCSYGFDY